MCYTKCVIILIVESIVLKTYHKFRNKDFLLKNYKTPFPFRVKLLICGYNVKLYSKYKVVYVTYDYIRKGNTSIFSFISPNSFALSFSQQPLGNSQ